MRRGSAFDQYIFAIILFDMVGTIRQLCLEGITYLASNAIFPGAIINAGTHTDRLPTDRCDPEHNHAVRVSAFTELNTPFIRSPGICRISTHSHGRRSPKIRASVIADILRTEFFTNCRAIFFIQVQLYCMDSGSTYGTLPGL